MKWTPFHFEAQASNLKMTNIFMVIEKRPQYLHLICTITNVSMIADTNFCACSLQIKI